MGHGIRWLGIGSVGSDQYPGTTHPVQPDDQYGLCELDCPKIGAHASFHVFSIGRDHVQFRCHFKQGPVMAVNPTNLPTVRGFKFEDFPGMPQAFANFLESLNLFVNPVYDVLNGGIGVQNLVAPKTFMQVITTPAAGSVTFNFTNPLKIVPSAVLLGNVYVNGNPSNHPTNPSMVYWHFSQGKIYVDNVTNLTAATTYVILLVVL